MSTTAARVDILLQLQSDIRAISQTVGGLRSVNQEVKKVRQNSDDLAAVGGKLRGVAQGIAGIFGIGFSASFIAQQVRGTIQWAGALQDLADQAHMTTDAFQILSVAFMDAGVKPEELSRAVETLRKNLQDAVEKGSSPLNDSLAILGLTARGLQAIAPERQFEVLGQRINAATDKQAAFNAAVELLGSKNAPKLLATLRQIGAEGYDKLAEANKSLTLSKEQVEALDRAGDSWERIAYWMKVTAARGIVAVDKMMTGVSPEEQALVDSGELNQRIKTVQSIEDRKKLLAEIAGQIAEMEKQKARFDRLTAVTPVYKLSDSVVSTGRYASTMLPNLQKAQAFLQSPKSDALMSQVANTPPDANAVAMREAEIRARAAALAKANAEIQAVIEEGANAMRQFQIDQAEKDNAALDKERQKEAEEAGQKRLNDTIYDGERALADYRRALSLVEASPFLTDTQKRAERVRSLQEENDQIAKQIQLLEKTRGLPGVDPAQLTAQQRELSDKSAKNSGEIAAGATLDMGQSGVAGLVDYLNQIPTLAERARSAVTGIASAMEDGIANALRGLIYQTMTWQQALSNIAMGVVNEIINSFIRMAAQWITQQIVMAIFGNALRAAQLAALAPVAAASAAMWAPAATAASIATLGGAAVSGATAAKVAIASSVVGFAEGGYTGAGGKYDVAGLVHAGEFVFPADVTAKLGPDTLYGFMNAVRAPSGLGASGAGVGVGGRAISSAPGRAQKAERLIVHTNDAAVVKRLMQDTTYQNQVVRLNRRTRAESGYGF